jgi:hypothetical protein
MIEDFLVQAFLDFLGWCGKVFWRRRTQKPGRHRHEPEAGERR